MPLHALGFLSDEEKKADFYNSCDLFLSVAKYDNLPNMIMESLSCGTPVAAFGNGGIPALVNDGNGILVSGSDAPEMARRIECFFNSPRRNDMAEAARTHVLANYAENVVAQAHQRLYKSICG